MRIGVISDTHGYFDAQLPMLLNGVEEILHAGDVGSRPVLDSLRAIAPVFAVQGNVDSPALELPLTLLHSCLGIKIYLLHELLKPQSTVREWASARRREGSAARHCRDFLESLPADCQVVIFGHTHEPCALKLEGRLFINPGSAGKKRFSLPRCCGILEISPQGVQATFLGLERYNEDLPEGIYLPVGGP